MAHIFTLERSESRWEIWHENEGGRICLGRGASIEEAMVEAGLDLSEDDPKRDRPFHTM